MVKLFSASQIQKLDKQSEELGFPGELLMEQASLLAAERIARLVKTHKIQQIVIVAGPGNNGADGLAVSRWLAANLPVRQEVAVFAPTLGSNSKLFIRQKHLLKNFKVSFLDAFPKVKNMLVVDALFGVGLTRELSSDLENLIDAMNSAKWRVALDVPTGLNASTGTMLGRSVFRSQKTYAFGFLKTGFFCQNGPEYCGQIELLKLSYPNQLMQKTSNDQVNGVWLYGKLDFIESFPQRKPTSHKGNYGQTLALVGWGYPGAALLVVRALQALGCGYCHFVEPASDLNTQMLTTSLLKQEPQVLVHSYEELLSLLERATSVILGSGCDPKAITSDTLNLLIRSRVSTLADAGALSALKAAGYGVGKKLPGNWILTPHPGEAALLLNSSAEQINNDRVSSAQQLVQTYGGTVVLKGHKTVIASQERGVRIIDSGNEALAKAGSGDVLSGLIGSLLAQKIEPFEAACMGCWLHGFVADTWVKEKYSGSLTAQKIIDAIPNLIKHLLI